MILNATPVAPAALGSQIASREAEKSSGRNECRESGTNPDGFASSASLFSALSESNAYREYHAAFETSTGLSLSLRRPGEKCQRGSPEKHADGSSFSALMARMNRHGEDRVTFQKELEEEAQFEPKTLKCFAGLCETAVPVRVGEKVAAFLQTGGVLDEKPNQPQFSRIAREFLGNGTSTDLKQAEDAYFKLRVLIPSQYQAMIKLLSMFAAQLGACGKLLVLQRTGAQQPAVARAREIIDAGFQEELSLGSVARQVNVSAGYFSEVFKKDTGLNFAEYVARLRVRKAESLLHTSKTPIGKIAFEAGFQTLSQFNRTFRRCANVAPRAYRASLVEAEQRNLRICAVFPPRCGDSEP